MQRGLLSLRYGKLYFCPGDKLAPAIDLSELGFRVGYRCEKLAMALRVSRRTLEREFKRSLGISPKKWLAEQRMLKALELIRSGKTLHETSRVLGFKRHEGFRLEAKKYFGMTPRELIQAEMARTYGEPGTQRNRELTTLGYK